MQVFAPSTAIWFLINFQTCYQVLNFSEKLLINRSFIIQKFPMFFSFFLWYYIGGWKVAKGDLYSRWKHVHACLSVYVWQERSSPTFCNYFSQQIPINPNTQTCKRLWACSVTTSVETSKRTISDPPEYAFVSSVPIWMAVDFSLWALASAHHAPSRTSTSLCLNLALECNRRILFGCFLPYGF